MVRKVEDASILEKWNELPSVCGLAKHFGIAERAMATRIHKLRSRGHRLECPDRRSKYQAGYSQAGFSNLDQHPAAIPIGIEEGHILIGSDSHYWPGIVTTAHRAFVEFAKEYKPKVIIKNGDETDFPGLSRHAPIGWENRPKVSDEVDACKAMLSEIEKVSPDSRRIWPCGNHDARFETRLATVAPEYAK